MSRYLIFAKALLAHLTITALEKSQAAVRNTLASAHSLRSHRYAIERFIAWHFGNLTHAVRSAQIYLLRTGTLEIWRYKLPGAICAPREVAA